MVYYYYYYSPSFLHRFTHPSQIVLTPIENATEIISDRVQATVQELMAEPVNIKTLQIILQGSVIPQVNAGPLAIARDFLGSSDQFPAPHVDRLRSAFARFLQVNSEALRRNKALIDPSQMDFQAQCEQGFAIIKKEIEAHLKAGATAGRASSGVSNSSDSPPPLSDSSASSRHSSASSSPPTSAPASPTPLLASPSPTPTTVARATVAGAMARPASPSAARLSANVPSGALRGSATGTSAPRRHGN